MVLCSYPMTAAIGFGESAIWDNCVAYSPPREEGWTRHQKNAAKPPYWRGRGGRLRVMFRCERPPRLRREGGLRRNFLDAAATPPHEEGTTLGCRADR